MDLLIYSALGKELLQISSGMVLYSLLLNLIVTQLLFGSNNSNIITTTTTIII